MELGTYNWYTYLTKRHFFKNRFTYPYYHHNSNQQPKCWKLLKKKIQVQIGASSKTCFVRLSREFLLESEWAERSSTEDLRLFLLQHQYDELISKHWGFLLWYHNSKKEIPDFTWTYNDKLIMTSESEWMNVSYSFTWSISIYISSTYH